MDNLAGKVAFITGAASGIGLGIARALAGAGVHVALADVEAPALSEARRALDGSGVNVSDYVVDVADRAAMYEAAREVEAAFGGVDILINNAGVGFVGTPLDEIRDEDLDWVISVNLYGVLNGVKAFVPLIKRRGGGHVVNTSSIGGFQVKPGWHHGLYSLTKYAVVAISEALREDLEPFGIGVSVLAPAAVRTRIYQAGRNRPATFGGAFRRPDDHPVAKLAAHGISPDAVGLRVLRAIKMNELFVFTHPETRAWLEERHRRLMEAFDEADRLAVGSPLL